MIDYLIQTTSAHSDLLRAVSPPGLLSPAEAARCGALRADTRWVSVVPRPEVAEMQAGRSSSPPRWLRMDVQVSQELVDQTASNFSKFEGWWQVYEGFVLAIVTRR